MKFLKDKSVIEIMAMLIIIAVILLMIFGGVR